MPAALTDSVDARPGVTGRDDRGLRRLVTMIVILPSLFLVACAHSPPVQPWQREHLAKRAMRFDSDPMEMRFRQHMFGAREGSDLGYGQPGGGCGCN